MKVFEAETDHGSEAEAADEDGREWTGVGFNGAAPPKVQVVPPPALVILLLLVKCCWSI